MKETREEIIERARQTEREISAEFNRLEKTVPYGVCYQVHIETLRALKTPEEGRAFYARWLGTDVVSAAGKTDLSQ